MEPSYFVEKVESSGLEVEKHVDLVYEQQLYVLFKS
jgi:hypothetical protein